MSERTCPVKGCGRPLGTTKRGDPWLMCRAHWARVDVGLQYRIWRAYRSWQRCERAYLKAKAEGKAPGPLNEARVLAISAFIDIRNDAIRMASRGEAEQMEMAQ